MRQARAGLAAILAGAALTGVTALAADGPLGELERSLRDLENTVRAIHETRLEAAREAERGRASVAQLDAEARDLEREAAAAEDQVAPLRASTIALEKERDAAAARRAKLEADRSALRKVVTNPDRSLAAPGAAFVDSVRALEARLEQARTCSVEADGAVRLGSVGKFDPASAAGRSLADQLSKRAAPGLVRVPVELGEGFGR